MRLDLRAAAAGMCCAAALAAPPPLAPQLLVSGLQQPVEIAAPDDGTNRLFVVEQPGRIRVIKNGTLLPAPFLDIRAAAGGSVVSGSEAGLLGLALHPGYAANGRFYVFYTQARPGDPGGFELVVARFQRSAANADVADASSGAGVIVIQHPQQGNHNGGKIAFGPDGYLYIGVGDGGGGGDPFNAGQSLTDLRGKILRIDVDSALPYAIPPTNPFAASSDPAVRKEIWAYGLRNPWRFSFDRSTGDLFIGDVGQGAWEEIDFQPANAPAPRNYGWRIFEGTHCFNPPSGCSLAGHVPPILKYAHDANGGFSVTGGYRYRGTALAGLAGHYLYGDYVTGRVWAATDASGSWVPTQVANVSSLSAFGEDASGELLAANRDAGTIVRLTPAATTLPRLVNLSTRARSLVGEDVVIGGFVIGGTRPKTIVVRGRGPSLAAAGVASPLANPVLQLFQGSTALASNDDFGSAPNLAQLQALGFAPSHPSESAILATLVPGAYTAILSGASGGTGVGLVEIFEVDHPELPLMNISTRARVQTGEDVVIAGFIVQGSGPQTVVVRARGPSLAGAGVADPLADPVLELVRSSDGVTLAVNNDWQVSPNAAAVASSGFAPDDAREAAILVTLDPGAYTAIVTGSGGGTGVAIVEVFR